MDTASQRAFIGIGSNQGDKIKNINNALGLLNNNKPEVALIKVASFYKTEPVGYLEQDWFINTVAEIETILAPRDLLKLLMFIEEKMGRRRAIRWGPRNIDLDILLYGALMVKEPELEIPHPRLTERAFVVVPLAEINPDMILPGGVKAYRLGAKLQAEQQIVKLSFDNK